MSHDLRTPLTRLRLTLAMLPQSGRVDAASLVPDIGGMVSDVEEMDRMIEGYLSFARGEGAEQAEPVCLAVLLEEVAGAAVRTGAEVLSVSAGPMPEIVLRQGAIRRVLTNLLENARRHGGRIAIAAAAEARAVVVLVDDDGPGIPDHRREQMFRAFESGSGRRHRARPDHRAGHHPGAWRRHLAGAQPAGRLARADQAAGLRFGGESKARASPWTHWGRRPQTP